MTLQELRSRFETELKGIYPVEEIRSLFEFALSEITGMTKKSILFNYNMDINTFTEEKLYNALYELKRNIPIQYIFGKAYFYGLELEVNENVLIPRPETEELVDWIIKDNKGKALNILDAGTGSGCIALALKKNLPECSITGIDISNDALLVAKRNAGLLDLDVDFKKADILNLRFKILDFRFDIIVANPPYIKESDMKFVGKNVLNREPHKALFVPDKNPYIYYEHLLKYAGKLKTTTLYFEIHEEAANEVSNLCKKYRFTDITIRKDLNGKNRMLKCANSNLK